MIDDLGQWSKWIKNVAKVAVGIVAIGVGVAVAVSTGGASVAIPALTGALKVAFTGAAIGATTTASYRVVKNRIDTGSWKGSGKFALDEAIDGAADGFMRGGIIGGSLSANGVYVQKVGRLKGNGKSGNGYFGVKYQSNNKTRSIEIHPPHNGGPHQYWHLQRNKWHNNGNKNGPLNYVKTDKHWPICWGKLK